MEFMAPVLIALGFLAYWFYIWREQIRPNTACWIMWVALSVFRMSQFGSVPDFLGRGALILDASGCVITWLAAILIKNSVKSISKIRTVDWILVAILVICLGMLRFSSRPELFAGLTLATLFALSFSPMLGPGGSLRNNPTTEKPLPWLIWAASAVPDVWGQNNPYVLLNSGLAVILQLVVACIAFRGSRNILLHTTPTVE